jgi:hypothetical protein
MVDAVAVGVYGCCRCGADPSFGTSALDWSVIGAGLLEVDAVLASAAITFGACSASNAAVMTIVAGSRYSSHFARILFLFYCSHLGGENGAFNKFLKQSIPSLEQTLGLVRVIQPG